MAPSMSTKLGEEGCFALACPCMQADRSRGGLTSYPDNAEASMINPTDRSRTFLEGGVEEGLTIPLEQQPDRFDYNRLRFLAI